MFFYVTLQSALKPSLNDICPSLVLFEGDEKKNSKKWGLIHCGNR